jgi:hypothetical protein
MFFTYDLLYTHKNPMQLLYLVYITKSDVVVLADQWLVMTEPFVEPP